MLAGAYCLGLDRRVFHFYSPIVAGPYTTKRCVTFGIIAFWVSGRFVLPRRAWLTIGNKSLTYCYWNKSTVNWYVSISPRLFLGKYKFLLFHARVKSVMWFRVIWDKFYINLVSVNTLQYLKQQSSCIIIDICCWNAGAPTVTTCADSINLDRFSGN